MAMLRHWLGGSVPAPTFSVDTSSLPTLPNIDLLVNGESDCDDDVPNEYNLAFCFGYGAGNGDSDISHCDVGYFWYVIGLEDQDEDNEDSYPCAVFHWPWKELTISPWGVAWVSMGSKIYAIGGDNSSVSEYTSKQKKKHPATYVFSKDINDPYSDWCAERRLVQPMSDSFALSSPNHDYIFIYSRVERSSMIYHSQNKRWRLLPRLPSCLDQSIVTSGSFVKNGEYVVLVLVLGAHCRVVVAYELETNMWYFVENSMSILSNKSGNAFVVDNVWYMFDEGEVLACDLSTFLWSEVKGLEVLAEFGDPFSVVLLGKKIFCLVCSPKGSESSIFCVKFQVDKCDGDFVAMNVTKTRTYNSYPPYPEFHFVTCLVMVK